MQGDEDTLLGIDPQKDLRPVRGRKPAYESRAAEFRQRLMVWKGTAESSRPSLRALAVELGTSHQIRITPNLKTNLHSIVIMIGVDLTTSAINKPCASGNPTSSWI